MKILISTIFGIDSYSRGIMPDLLQSKINKDPSARIFYLTNSHSFDICYFNIEKKPDVCYRCTTGIKNSLKLVDGKFTHLKVKDLVSREDKDAAKAFFSNKPIIKFIHTYEGFEVGAATLSTYISQTRDRDLENVDQPLVKELAVNALALYLGIQRFLQKENIDLVYNFNGRHEYVRAVMKASRSQNIDCYNVERARIGGYIEFYKNVLPHNILNKKAAVEDFWNESPLTQQEKEKIGANFFTRQKSGESILFPSFTRKMTLGNTPEIAKNGNKNIVVFNSSDDEFAALGEEYNSPYFRDQLEGLQYLAYLAGEHLKDYNLIIRMHPNLAGVEKGFVSSIKDLHNSFPNVSVVFPESNVDTYALMDLASKIVSFGSTTGLEANYKRLPVILLGKSYYFYSDVAYVPKDKSQILELLKEDLEPRPLTDTLKFGFYYLRGGQKTKYYYEGNEVSGIFLKGHRVHDFSLLQRIKAKIIQLAYQKLNLRLYF